MEEFVDILEELLVADTEEGYIAKVERPETAGMLIVKLASGEKYIIGIFKGQS